MRTKLKMRIYHFKESLKPSSIKAVLDFRDSEISFMPGFPMLLSKKLKKKQVKQLNKTIQFMLSFIIVVLFLNDFPMNLAPSSPISLACL